MKFSGYTNKDSSDIAKEFSSSFEIGLSTEVSRKLFSEIGPNEIEEEATPWWKVFFRQFNSVFIYLLLSASVLTLILGEYTDTFFIILFVAINTLLGFRQEFHSEKTIALLRGYFSFKSKVLRDGKMVNVLSCDVVPGDMIYLEAGDRIPADIRFASVESALVDESPLTGESVPVEKISESLKEIAHDVYSAKNIGFAGTTLVSGEATGIVVATGKDRMMESISRIDEKVSHQGNFERGLARFSRLILYLVFGTLIVVFLANYFLKPHFSPIAFMVFSIALAISVVPEALPLVITFSLSRGAVRLVKKKVVVKRLHAVEALGSIEVLASDKTGTLTENKLTVSKIQATNNENFLLYANLCSSVEAQSLESSDNSFDRALFLALSENQRKELGNWKRVAKIPFDPVRKRNSVMVEREGKTIMIVMGAPEVVMNFCGIDHTQRQALLQWIKGEGESGHRTIALAKKSHDSVSSYKSQEEEEGLEFYGLVSFIDPIKPSTVEAVLHARKLGVGLKIITGDSKEVAGAVAEEIGLIHDKRDVLYGEDFRNMNASERLSAVNHYHVFARVAPEVKRFIVESLKEKYDVGFLGEAMNDVQALRAANVSIVVDTASDIARSVADIILLKRDLSVIVNGIREGREVFTNTVKYLKATLLSNLGNFYAVAIASLITDTLPLLPVQILLLNLLSDFPMMTIATDSVDSDELQKPKQYNVREITTIAVALGFVSTVFDFVFFAMFFRFAPEVLRTNWFIGSILTELVLIFSIRTRGFFLKAKAPSLPLVLFSCLAFAVTIALPFISKLAPFLGLIRPSVYNLSLILGVVAVYFIVTEGMKIVIYRHLDGQKA